MLNGLKESNPLLILAGIILIPIGVAVVSLWVDTRIDERQRKAAEDLFQRQQALTVAQTMDSYFQGVGMLLTESPDQPESTRLVVARTNALLNRLGRAEDRALIVRFVSELSPGLTARPERMLERASKPFIDLAELEERAPVDGYRARFVHSDNMTLAYWTIDAGAALPEHSHPHEQVCNVIEGEFELVVGGVAKVMRPGDVAVIPSGVPHSGKSVTDCRIIDVFQPVREDYR